MTILIVGQKVYAEEFYEAEYLDKTYMNKVDYATNTIYYQRSRAFRNKATGELVYCIEPLTFFQENSIYEQTTTPRNLTQSQIDRIKKIAYFGYRYKDHLDGSWYSVTQLMIWRESNPTGGEYYFTDTLNGNRTNAYDPQINEINHLINIYDHEIPIKDQTITLVEGMTKEIEIGEVLDFYSTNNEEIELKDHKIIINSLSSGDYSITLTREHEVVFGKPTIMYQSPNSQTLMLGGDLEPKEIHFNIKVISNSIEIEKVDLETNQKEAQGDANLNGSLFQLLDQEENEIDSIEIIDYKGIIKNIPFGTYYIKETIPGIGYELNNTVYEITITEESPNQSITIPNQVIKKEIVIKKTYKDNEPEPFIEFQIQDKSKNIVAQGTTNKEGIISFTLPYGEYSIHQINTTDGYQMIDPFTIKVEDTESEAIELYDFKIPVPNTNTNIIIWIIQFIVMLIC